MIVAKCPICEGTSLLKIHVPHVKHEFLHATIHHSKEIAQAARAHPLLAGFGLLATGVGLLGKALMNKEYRCRNCSHEFNL